MRRWFFGPAVVSLGVLAALGSHLLSGNNAKQADTPAAPKNTMSRITRVTVYHNSALVTREVEVPDGAGLAELVINPMPPHVVTSSLYAEGAEGIRVLTTRYRTRQVLEDTSEERRKLEAEKEKLQVIAAKIQSEMTSIQQNMNLVGKLEGFTEKTALTSTEKGGLNGDTVITLAKWVMDQRADKAKELVALADQKRLNDIQLAFCDRKMAELGRGGGREERDAVVVVDREAGKGGKVRLNYLVAQVHWRPEYKLRAGKTTEDVKIECLANLVQQSGEDWNQVEMTLSTAQPMLNAAPPELAMLEPVLVARGGAPGAGPAMEPFASAKAPKEVEATANSLRDKALGTYSRGDVKGQKAADGLLNTAAASEQQLELMKSREQIRMDRDKKANEASLVSNDGPSVTYHLANKLTVPSRNDEQIVEIAKLSLTPRYYYKAVPVLNRHVYRLADLVNKSNHVLLPGEATMYQGSDFVGRMALPLVAVGEEFASWSAATRPSRSSCKSGTVCPRRTAKASASSWARRHRN
jgi:hypothetical protein